MFLFITDASTTYDPRANAFNSFRSLEDGDTRLIFAGGQGLNYRCFSSCFDARTKSMNFNSFRGSAYDWMLALKYDLDVAEYKMNWGAKEALGKELLETIGGSHGLSPIDPRDDQAQINKMNNFMDLIALQASIAVDHSARQRKTTQYCQEKMRDVCPRRDQIWELVRQEATGLDEMITTAAQTARTSEFIVQMPEITYNANNVREFMELARVITNPIHNENIYKVAWNTFNDAEFISAIRLNFAAGSNAAQVNRQAARTSYDDAVRIYLGQNFNFMGNSRLQQTAQSYFEKLYEKGEKLLRYREDAVRLKLRDCNGGDIYGNGNVCSFNSLLDLIRQEPGNLGFVTAGGMLSSGELRSWNTTPLGQEWISSYQYYDRSQTHYVPYRKFDQYGRLIQYIQPQQHDQQQVDMFYRSPEAVNLMPTNDLCS